uniref:helix-hairpin-helix domain-containing protein n=1 Tax=Halomonas sp. TaxID=1486246 RepID=UPI0026236A06|nr:helix-hairpin-helix domain-containing protein [Halomonas sp.]
MAFSNVEREQLLALKGVGPLVVARLEQIGIDCFAVLAGSDVEKVLADISAMLGATCWRNSPQARGAIESAVALARQSRTLG